MAFVVTKTVHVDHNDVADMFVEGAYHEDQALLFNAIGERFDDEAKRLEDMAEQVAKHLNEPGRMLIEALAESMSSTDD